MIIRKIPVYTLKTEEPTPLSQKSFRATDFAITFPALRAFTDREQTLLEAGGALTARMICRTLDIASEDGEMRGLRCENCFDANEKDEWILDISFTTVTKEGEKLTCPLRLPLSLPRVADEPITLWFDGTWMRLLLDGEVLNENAGVGDLCLPESVVCHADITVAAVENFTRTYRTEEADIPADFYTPHGFNTNVGDVMAFYRDGVYHLVYLIDRRHHGSRGGRGAHYLAHLTTRDLITWEEQEPVAEIERPYETFGTGTMFFHAGKYYMSFGLHTSRHPSGKFIEPMPKGEPGTYEKMTYAEALAEGGMPQGATLAVSEDGIHFKRLEILYHGSQNPSVYSTEDGGLMLYAGYGHNGVYRADSMEAPFVRTESKLVYHGKTTALNCSDECPAFFEMNGYRYLIVGFCGYFRALSQGSEEMVDALKLGENIYDGLCVPMVAELPNGRRLIAGWIRCDLGWGSVLMQRELVQEEGGRLGMRWIPELFPEKIGAPLTPDREGGFALKERSNYIYEAEVETAEDGIFALDILGEGAATQLRIDLGARKAQFADTDGSGRLTDLLKTPYELRQEDESYDGRNAQYSDNYAIPDVRLGRRFSLRILFRYEPKLHTTVCDVEIDRRRTMILTKANFFVNGTKTVHGKADATVTSIKR